MASPHRRPTVTVPTMPSPDDHPVKVATNATIFVFIESDRVIAIFRLAGQIRGSRIFESSVCYPIGSAPFMPRVVLRR